MAKNLVSINDKKIKDYRKKVEDKRKELGLQPKPAYITNQLLPLGNSQTRDKINLNLLNSTADCIGIASQLVLQGMANEKANEILGTKEYIVLGGHTIPNWLEDIKSRVNLIKWKEEKIKLDAMDKKLQDLLSADAKTMDAIADIASELGE